MQAIVVVDQNWAIGLGNNLLFSLPTDMKHFRGKTLNKVVVMGHSTLRSFPDAKPLAKRTNVVLSRNQQLQVPGAAICHSLEELTLYLQQFDTEDIILVGGQTIYEQLLDYCSTVYVTKVHASVPADSYFPNLDLLCNWKLANESDPLTDGTHTFTICEYHNRQVKTLETTFTPAAVKIRQVSFGTGSPKICVPIQGASLSALLRETEKNLVNGVDCIEWRADFFEDIANPQKLAHALVEMRGVVGGLPLLFTLRTKAEGGRAEFSPTECGTILEQVIKSQQADLVDLELSWGEAPITALIAEAKKHGCSTVLSYHNFDATPSVDTLVDTLQTMESLGATIPKIAVYPHTPADVITLLAASEIHARTAKTPFIALSMSWLGSISRIAGEFFGSAITFASPGTPSAPGQIEVQNLRDMLLSLEEPEGTEQL